MQNDVKVSGGLRPNCPPNRRLALGKTSIRWGWVLACSFALLTIVCAGYAAWKVYANSPEVDFVSFWAAGRLVLQGRAAFAYDFQAHRLVELTASHLQGLMPFVYPPPFLLLVAPLGLLPFKVAFVLWVTGTAVFYVIATRPIARLPYSLVLPAAIPTVLIGQNGFLFTGIFTLAITAMRTQPFKAGLYFGLLALKPQLALLVPVALLASGEWRAIGGAVLSSTFLLLIGLFAFGANSYVAFFMDVREFSGLIAKSHWTWNELASIFGFARSLGLGNLPALLIQALFALAAITITARAWVLGLSTRTEILATASVLVSPYLFTYDSLLLIIPFSWFLRHGHRSVVVAIWLCCLFAMSSYFSTYTGPNPVPIAATLSLILLHRFARAEAGEATAAHSRVVGLNPQPSSP